jgi:hypothetical protein
MPLTPETVTNFAMVGIAANFAMIFVSFILTTFKAFTLNKTELVEVIKFFKVRKSMIKENNTGSTLFFSHMLIFLPFYTAWIYVVYLWFLMLRPGLWGMISASVNADKFSIIQLVRYEFISLKDK